MQVPRPLAGGRPGRKNAYVYGSPTRVGCSVSLFSHVLNAMGRACLRSFGASLRAATLERQGRVDTPKALCGSTRREGTVDTLSTGHQEQVGSGSTSQSDRDHVIVSDIVVSKIAGLAAQEMEGVQVSSGHAQPLGGFLDRVSTNGHPQSVSAIVDEEGVTIELTIDVHYGKPIPQITEAVRSSVIRRVQNEVGHEVSKVDIIVNDVVHSEVMQPSGQVEKEVAEESKDSTSEGELVDSSVVPSAAMPGEAYFDLWSRSLQQYRQMTDAFFRPYSDRPRQSDEEKDER